MSQRSGELLLKAIRALPKEEQDEVLIALLGGQAVGSAKPLGAGTELWLSGEPVDVPTIEPAVSLRQVPVHEVRVTPPPPGGEGLRVLPVRLPADAYERLRTFAKEHDFSMAVIIRTLVERFLEGQAPPEAPPSPSPA